MVLKIYSVRDSKAQLFGAPWYKNTHGEAERDFSRLVNDKNSTVSQFPEDFDLYYLGEYDDNTGKFMSLDTPQHVVKAIQVKSNEPKVQALN